MDYQDRNYYDHSYHHVWSNTEDMLVLQPSIISHSQDGSAIPSRYSPQTIALEPFVAQVTAAWTHDFSLPETQHSIDSGLGNLPKEHEAALDYAQRCVSHQSVPARC